MVDIMKYSYMPIYCMIWYVQTRELAFFLFSNLAANKILSNELFYSFRKPIVDSLSRFEVEQFLNFFGEKKFSIDFWKFFRQFFHEKLENLEIVFTKKIHLPK